MRREREYEMNQKFRAIYEKYQAALRTIARRCGIGYNDIEDVIQETFAAYFENYVMKDVVIKSEKAMLVRILKRKCVDLYRKNYQFAMTELETKEGMLPAEILYKCMEKDVSNIVIQRERYREIRSVIEGMKPEWRDVIVYCCIFDYSSAEASAILGISGTACRSRLMRARIYLRKQLGLTYEVQPAE